jgi:hypothetical protein
MEESGGPLEFVHIQKEEDQLQWSAAASSCDSGGFKPAAAEVVVEVFGDSESDGSVQGHHRSGEEQGGLGPLENNRNFEIISQDPLVNTVEGLPGFSIGGAEVGGLGKGQGGASDEIQVVRGMSTSCSEVQGCVQKGGIVDLEVFGEKELELPEVSIGPVLPPNPLSPIIGDPLVDPLEPVWAESGVDLYAGQAQGAEQLDSGPAGFVIEKLDGLILEARDKGVGVVNPLSQGELSDLSTSASSSQSTYNSLPLRKGNRSNKPPKKLPPRPPSHLSGGPKCIRFAEAVNNAGVVLKKRVVPLGEGGVSSSRAADPVEAVVSPVGVTDATQQSGVNFIMGEDDLEDVEGFIAKREEPIAKISEAELIVQIQSDLGINYAEGAQASVDNLVQLEDRDRAELNIHVEANRSQ